MSESSEPRPYGRRDFLTRLAQRSVAEFLDDHCPQLAASISYHVLFSLFPLAIVFAGIFGIVVRATGVQADVVDAIVRNLPLDPGGRTRLRDLLEGATGNLSALGLLGLVGLIYAASGMMSAIRLALNQAWDVDEYRPLLRGKLVDVALVFVAAVFAAGSLVLTVAVRTAGSVAAHAGVDPGAGWASWLLGLVVPLVFSFSVVLFLYSTVPAVEVHFLETWPAALLTACVFVVTENLFAVYVQHFANYNAIYGSLGAVIAFMFFTYLSAMVFLLGAEIASEWPRVRETLAHGEVEEGPPAKIQARQALKGLWTRRRQEEGRREQERVEGR